MDLDTISPLPAPSTSDSASASALAPSSRSATARARSPSLPISKEASAKVIAQEMRRKRGSRFSQDLIGVQRRSIAVTSKAAHAIHAAAKSSKAHAAQANEVAHRPMGSHGGQGEGLDAPRRSSQPVLRRQQVACRLWTMRQSCSHGRVGAGGKDGVRDSSASPAPETPMSLPMMIRMSANLIQAKLTADARCVRAGKPTVEMGEFVQSQMLSIYGMKSMAEKYMREMRLGLDKIKVKPSRLALFVDATVGDNSASRMPHSTVEFSLRMLDVVIVVLCADAARLRVSRSAFFQKFALVNEVFVPREHLERALEEALDLESPAFRESLHEIGSDFIRDNACANEAECAVFLNSRRGPLGPLVKARAR
eukprot:1982362-Pleurochrysis_carterae.AAC.2